MTGVCMGRMDGINKRVGVDPLCCDEGPVLLTADIVEASLLIVPHNESRHTLPARCKSTGRTLVTCGTVSDMFHRMNFHRWEVSILVYYAVWRWSFKNRSC